MTLDKQPRRSMFFGLQLFMLAAIICLGIYVRIVDLDRQFTHIDDLGVAETILGQDERYDIEYVRKRIHDTTHEGFNSLPYRILRSLDASNRLEAFLPLLKNLLKLVIVPWVWTYAPLQFPLTSLLLSHDQSYKEILFWGRFPSFLSGCLALILIVFLHRKIAKEDYFLPAFTSVLFLSLTWENIIYAKHMSSYAIGVLAAIALLYALTEIIKRDHLTAKSSLLLGTALAIISHMQYQVLFYMPAFYLTWLMVTHKTTVSRLSSLRHLLLTATAHGAMILPMVLLFLLHRTDRGITWSGSFSFPILFDPGQDISFAGKLNYALEFFSGNSYKVVDFLFAFSPSAGNPLFINILLITAIVAGMYKLLASAVKTEKAIGLFFLLCLLSTVGLILSQKLTFGPTRHSLFFMPYLAVSASFGFKLFVEFFQRWGDKRKTDLVCASTIFAIVIAVFLPSLGPALKERQDLFVESEFAALIAKYKPDFIIAQAAGNLSFMEPSKDWAKQYSSGVRAFTLFGNPAKNNTGVYMLVHFSPFNRENLREIKNDFNLGADFDNPGAYTTVYEREENTGACVDVCVEKKTGENGISVQIFTKNHH